MSDPRFEFIEIGLPEYHRLVKVEADNRKLVDRLHKLQIELDVKETHIKRMIQRDNELSLKVFDSSEEIIALNSKVKSLAVQCDAFLARIRQLESLHPESK